MTTPVERADPQGVLVAERYEIIRPLGHGSFGHTFLARDRTDGRSVAVKMLDARARDAWKAHELFEREASVLRSLRHQAIPAVFDTPRGEWEGAPASFLVMEHIEGVSLSQIIAESRPLEQAQVIHLFLELLGVLEYLHGRTPPILHRDIKPSNIIVRADGSPALVDFGSVRRVFHAPDESGSTIAGTYGYMPYEQYMGQAAPASDLYALGATFLHLLTGRPPRDFMNEEGRIAVPDALPGDARLRPIITRLLRASPAERYESARAARDAFLNTGSLPVPSAPRVRATLAPIRALPLPAAVPRPIEGETRKMFEAAAPSMFEMMDSSRKPSDDVALGDYVSFGFFTLITIGILPVVFWHLASSRRRRLRRFFQYGVPGVAEILSIQMVSTAFDEKVARIAYQFEADGVVHRDADDGVLPIVAAKWQPGDQVQILYLPDRGYDSVIASATH